MPQSAASFLDDTPDSKLSAASFLDEAKQPSADSFLGDSAPNAPTVSVAPADTMSAGDRAAIAALIGESEQTGNALSRVHGVTGAPIIGYGDNKGLLATVPKIPQLPASMGPLNLTPQDPSLGIQMTPMLPLPPDVMAAGINVAGNVASGLTSPENVAMLGALGPVSKAAPVLGRIISGGFAADMGHSAYQQLQPTLQTINDPNATRQQKLEAAGNLGATTLMSGLAAVHAVSPSLAARISEKSPDQASKAIREEIKVTEDKATVDKLTDAADAIDREIAAQKAIEDQQKAQEKAAADQQRALEQQQKAQQDAQKQAADAQAKAAEVPKSTQILQESQTPPPLANIATEIGTQTSPYAVQEKLNQLTAPPPSPLDQIPGPAQGPAPILSEEQLSGRQRAAAMRAQRDAPVVPEEPTAPKGLETAKAAFERRKAIFDAEQRTKKEAAAAQKQAEADAADEAQWLADQQRKTAEANDPVKIKEQQVSDAVKNPDTEYLFTVQKGGEGYPGFVQVDAIMPSLREGERNTVSSNVKDFNKAGAKLPEVPDWVPQKQYTLDELKAVIKQGEPKNAIPIKETNAGVLRPEEPKVGLPEVGQGNAQPEVVAGNEVRQGPVQEPLKPGALPPDNRYDLLKGLNESQLMAVTKQLGVDPKGMSGERLRSRLSTNAREADIIEALANPVTEAAPTSKRGKIKGSAADKWAEKKINDSRGQVNSGIDPELLAAHVIKLAGQLESGAVKFGEWSRRVIDEVGEQIRPLLSRMWEEAHKSAGKPADLPPEPRIISGAEENRAQSEAITGHEYLKDTNKAQEESGQRYVDYVKKTQDWDGAIDAVERIPHLADRNVAIAQLLAEADKSLHSPDTLPEFDRIVNRLGSQVTAEKTNIGQAQQSQKVVNRIIEPLRPYLGWRRMIQTRLQDIAKKFAPDVSDQINTGMKDAGDEAAGVIKGAVDGKGTAPTIESVNKATPEIKMPAPTVDANLGERIMQRVRQSAGYREFFTKKGTKTIADRLFQLLAGAKKPEGNVWTFDSIVSSELGRILDEKMKAAGIESKPSSGISTAEKIAQFLSDDPLRKDKVKLIDDAVRAEIEKRSPEEAAQLSELWDSTVGAMADTPSSDTMARRIVQETLKDSKVKWNDAFRAGGDSLTKLKNRIVNAVADKVSGVPNGGDKLDLAAFKKQVGAVFDDIAGVRKAAFDKNKAIQDARAKAAASPEAEAATLLNQFAKLQSDTQAWTDKTIRPVKAALSDFLSGKSDRDTFIKTLDALGVKRATSETLVSVAERQKSVRDTWKKIADTEKLLASLEKNSALVGPIRKIAASLGIDWDQLFADLPETQAARKAEVLSRLSTDPKFSGLTESSKAKLVDALNNAWEQLRNDAFRREFSKVIKLPNVGREQREVLEKSLPKIVERANLGLMDNEAFLSAIGDKYGIEGIDGPTGKKLRDLGQQAARAPEGIERNEIYQKIMDTIMEARGVNAGDFLKDYWYRNVMSAPRTAFEIGTGGIVQGMARTFLAAADTATALKRPDIALRMIGMFIKDAATGARLGFDLIKTGDRAVLPRFKEQFMSKMDRLEQGKSPGGEIESIYRRSGPLGKVALAPFELTGRALTALDYIGGQGVRSQQMLYSALVQGDKASFNAAMRRFNANEVKSAETQARTEIGPTARPAQVIARTREILNEGISKDIQAYGNNMTEVTALNAKPVGLGGKVYDALKDLPMILRAPSGLGFVKAMINLVQESSNWAPVTGQINAARALWRNPSKTNPLRFLALDKVPPERARQIIAAQATGLALLAVTANQFLSDQPEDKEGKPRKWEISGGWDGLTPTQKGALMSAGEKPYAIKMPSGRWVDYKLTPFVAALATIGHWRDQQRFKGKKWDDETLTNKVGNAWLSGLGAVRDLSVSSQFSSLAGHMLATDSREPDTKGFMRTLTDTIGNSAVGLIPMSSLLRELDQSDDQQRYRPGKKNPGVDLWLSQVPFARRTVGDGPVLDFLGRPININVNPFNRHIGPGPSDDPVTAALSEKVSMGMKLPTLADNTQITEIKNGKPEKRPMTDEEAYNYQKAVRQGYARQLESDLPAFQKATPEQAALYSQVVFSRAEQYARDRLNTGARFDGNIPVDPKLSSALTPEYQQVKEMDSGEGSQAALDRAKLRVEYDKMMALPEAQRMAAIRDVAINNPTLAKQYIQLIVSPSTGRNSLEKAVGGLDMQSRTIFFKQELDKLKTREEKLAYLAQQMKAGLIK